MYSDTYQTIAEIYKFGSHENELESGVDSLQEGWSQEYLQESQVKFVQSESENQSATRADPPDKMPEIAGVVAATENGTVRRASNAALEIALRQA